MLIAADLTARLQVQPGDPGLRIVRRYLDPAGSMFKISITVHPADRFTLSMRLMRERSKA